MAGIDLIFAPEAVGEPGTRSGTAAEGLFKENEMEIKLHIEDSEIADLVKKEIVQRAACHFLEGGDEHDWDKREKLKQARLKDILKQIDWKKVADETMINMAKEILADKILKKSDY